MQWDASCQQEGVATIGGIKCVLVSILGIAAPLLALVALAMIVYSGARMIIGADNPKEIAAAQQTLVFAIIGLAGIGISWLILVVIKNLTGVDVLQLNF